MTPEQILLLKQTSHSSCETLYSCPRRYELDKLLANPEDTTATFDFGKAVGAGVQKWLETGDLDAAVWEVFQFWSLDLDDESEIKKKKTFWFAVAAVDSFRMMQLGPLKDWELMSFRGKPAVELSFRIDLGDGFFYRGYLDAALRHKTKKSLAVLECKTSGFNEPNEASYKNSNQGVGYSLILDSIAELAGIEEGPTYNVFYPVYSTPSMGWEWMQFAKSYTQRADFIQSLLMDKQVIQMYLDSGKFPKHGSSCFNFFRVCKHYDICDMSNMFLCRTDAGNENALREVSKKDAETGYDFEFTLDELIAAQLRRVGA